MDSYRIYNLTVFSCASVFSTYATALLHATGPRHLNPVLTAMQIFYRKVTVSVTQGNYIQHA